MEVSTEKRKKAYQSPCISCMLIFIENTNKTVLAIYKEESSKGVWKEEE
jgi:hypothetical protein